MRISRLFTDQRLAPDEKAELEARIALANYDAATVDLGRLGLAGGAGDG